MKTRTSARGGRDCSLSDVVQLDRLAILRISFVGRSSLFKSMIQTDLPVGSENLDPALFLVTVDAVDNNAVPLVASIIEVAELQAKGFSRIPAHCSTMHGRPSVVVHR